MKKIILINLLFLLVFTVSIEAKSSKGKVGKAIINIVKSVVKSKSKSKISNKIFSKIKSLTTSKNKILSNTKTNLKKLGKKVSSAKVRKTIPKEPGLYAYKEKSTKPYIGQTEDLQKRTLTHISTNKLPYQNVNTVRTKNIPKTELRSREKELIIKADKDTNGGLANIQHAKESRKKLLKTNF